MCSRKDSYLLPPPPPQPEKDAWRVQAHPPTHPVTSGRIGPRELWRGARLKGSLIPLHVTRECKKCAVLLSARSRQKCDQARTHVFFHPFCSINGGSYGELKRAKMMRFSGEPFLLLCVYQRLLCDGGERTCLYVCLLSGRGLM